MSFAEEIRDANRDAWAAMQSHRFVDDVIADRLPRDVFASYLVFEGAFVETAMAIFAYGLAKAPGLRQRVWLAGVVDALARDQIPYFETRFAELGIDPAAYEPLPPAVTGFREGMLKFAADGAYSDIIVAMLAAEWMYATWCGRAAAASISDPDLARWVALHAEPGFVAQAARLRAEADAIGGVASGGERARLSSVFGRALELEIAFHTAPYEGSSG